MKPKNYRVPGRRVLMFAALLLLTATAAFAQPSDQRIRRNTFFLELGGNALSYSFNYDRILVNRLTWKLSGRVGAQYLPLFQVSNRLTVGAPLELSYLRGQNKHFLEIGLGCTATFDTYLTSDKSRENLTLVGVARVGYRYQKPEGGLFYKVGFTPLAGRVYDLGAGNRGTSTAFTYPLVGLGLGYTLKK